MPGWAGVQQTTMDIVLACILIFKARAKRMFHFVTYPPKPVFRVGYGQGARHGFLVTPTLATINWTPTPNPAKHPLGTLPSPKNSGKILESQNSRLQWGIVILLITG